MENIDILQQPDLLMAHLSRSIKNIIQSSAAVIKLSCLAIDKKTEPEKLTTYCLKLSILLFVYFLNTPAYFLKALRTVEDVFHLYLRTININNYWARLSKMSITESNN